MALGSKVGCEPHMRHQHKGIFNQNANLEWISLAFEATRFGGALKSDVHNKYEWLYIRSISYNMVNVVCNFAHIINSDIMN